MVQAGASHVSARYYIQPHPIVDAPKWHQLPMQPRRSAEHTGYFILHAGAGQLACWGRGSWTWCKDVGGRGPRPVVGCAACAACACGPHPQHIPAHTPLPNAYTKRTIKAPRRMHAYAIHARLK